jgi:circadian clock protein KaiC
MSFLNQSSTPRLGGVSKLRTGIAGLDLISEGGLPEGRATLVAGTAGSAKTVMACKFLAAGINAGQSGIFVTFEEAPAQIRQNAIGLGWDIASWEAEGKWAFVDASPIPDESIVAGGVDFGALMARIESAARRVGARRAALDSIGSLFSQFADSALVRRELLRIVNALRAMNVTSVITAERTEEYGPISRHNVEEFVADNVVVLRNSLEEEKRRRTLEILKFRGAEHQKGEYPFTVMPGTGIVIIPLSAIELTQGSSDVRVSSGNDALDAMCGGGFFRDSIILVTGATGCGKTLMTTEFIHGGASRGERCLLFAFEEGHNQLVRNATGWGIDFEDFERRGLLRMECRYPESAGLEDHLIAMKRIMDEYKPDRVAVDSLSALERVSSIKGFREFVVGLTSFIKSNEIPGLFTATTPAFAGGVSITETHISTITDSIILLRYVEMMGEMRRGLTVLKMRGSRHDKEIREFTIDGSGLHVGLPFRNVTGILAGAPRHITGDELTRMEELFRIESAAAGA